MRELVRMKCLESYLNTNNFPRQYYKHLCKQKLRPTYRNLRPLTKTHIENINETHEKLQSSIIELIPILDNLNLCCRTKFFNFIRTLRERTRIQTEEEMKQWICQSGFEEIFSKNPGKYVINLSNFNLTRFS